MVNAIAFVSSYAVSALWQVPLLYLAGWLTARMLRRVGPAAEHRVWVAVLLLCVVVPALPAPQLHGRSVGVVISDAHVHSTSLQMEGPDRGWDIPLWLPVRAMEAIAAFWLLTTAYGASRLVIGLMRTRRMVESASRCELEGDQALAWDRCCRQFALDNPLVMETKSLRGPVTVSRGGRDILLLPVGFFSAVPQKDAYAALAHEAAHMQRHDFRNNLLLHAAATCIFFHPFTLLIRRQLSATREMACDAAASAQLGSAQTYRGALMRLALWMAQSNSMPQPANTGMAVGMFDSHSLEDRLERLKQETTMTTKLARYALVAAAFAGIAVTASALALNGMHLLPGTPEGKAQTQTSRPAPVSPTPKPDSSPSPKPGAKLVKPVLIHEVDPEFPEQERNAHAPGDHVAKIGITVDTAGVPQNVHVVQSAGEAFDASAIMAVSQYRFKPATVAGKVVATDLTIAVNYQTF